MPPVQRYGGQVDEAALPGVRVDGRVPAEAFGGGGATAGFEASGRVASDVVKFAQEERNKANMERGKKAYADLLAAKNDMYWGEGGVVSKRGLDAQSAPDEFLPRFNKSADEIEAGLANDDQKAMFRQMRAQEEGEFKASIDRHVFQEKDRWQADNHKFTTQALAQDAVKNQALAPWKVGFNLALIADNVADEAKRLGLGEDGKKAMMTEWTSKVHGGIVQQMLANGQDMKAKEYFDQTKTALTPDDEARLARAVEEGSTRGESQRIVDQITAVPGWVLSDAREKLKGIQDPKLRDAVDQRLQHEDSLRDRANEAEQEQAFTQIYGRLEQAGSIDKADPDMAITRLKPEYQRALRAFERQLKSGEAPKPDPAVYTRFVTMPAEKLAKVSPATLLAEAQPHVAPGEYHEILGRWRQAKEAATGRNPKAAAEFKSILSDDEMVIETLARNKVGGLDYQDTTASINKDSNKAATFKEFRQRLNTALEMEHTRTGKNPDDKVKREIIDRLVMDKVFVTKKRLGMDWLASDVEKPVSTLQDDERGNVYVPYDKVPDQARADIAAALSRAKIYPTDALIGRAYAAWLSGNKEIYNSILQGR